MKLTRKILASVLALVMVLLMLPAAFAAEETVHVLDVSNDLEAVAPSDENLGKEIVVNDYFTVIMGNKTKIDGSDKTFADDYVASQRLNFQHKTKIDENGVIWPAVKFTTSAAATIKLWWVEGGEDNRQFAILNEAGEEVTRTNETLAKNDKCISELTLEAAGTYYLGTPDGSNYLFKMEVTEAAAETPVEPAGYAAYLQFCDTSYTCWTQNGYDGVAAMGGAYIETDAKGVVPGAGTYTINYTLNPGSTAISAYLFYVEIVDAYEALKDLVLSDVHVSLDGVEIAVNQNVAYVNPYDFADAPANSIYVYHSTVEGSTNNYVIELSNLLAGVTAVKGAPIDLMTFAATESISITFTLSEPVEEPVGEPKTITIGDRTFTAAADKWVYNTAVTKDNAATYSMIIFDKAFEGTFETNGWGAAIVLDQYGTLVKIYDGANGGFWTEAGKSTDALTFSTTNFAVVAFNELQEGETLIIFPNDGVNDKDSARSFALGLRNAGTENPCECGKTATLDGFTFAEKPVDPIEPTVPETTIPETTAPEATEPVGPSGPSVTGDAFGIVVALMAVSGIALVALKKKEN